MKKRMSKALSVLLAVCFVLSCLSAITAGAAKSYTVILNEASAQRAADVPAPAFGAEWGIIGLARGGYYQTSNKYFTDYYTKVVASVKESVDENGALNANKSTENSRLIMALSAIGKDARSVGGHNLVAPYNDFSWIKKQGLSGPVYALLALDSHSYKTVDTTIRTQCINYILDAELENGGWTFFGSDADPDMTSMALQALAPYTNLPNVAKACTRGFDILSKQQSKSGGFASWGTENCESLAQVVVACTAHGINPNTDARFVKENGSAVDALLAFYDETAKKFRHTMTGSGNNMATEQAIYAFAAYKRLVESKSSLYDMDDAFPAEAAPVASLSVPSEVGGTAGTAFNASIALNSFNNHGSYKLIDCVVNVPEHLSVTAVTASSALSGGQLQYSLEESSGKLRIVYFDSTANSDIKLNATLFPSEVFTIALKVKRTLYTEVTPKLQLSVEGMSLKKSSDSSDNTAITVVNTDSASAEVGVVTGISYTAAVLYQGDGVDLIPTDKKAVAVMVAGLENTASLTYTANGASIPFSYNAAISDRTGVATYVAVVGTQYADESFASAESFNLTITNDRNEMLFGDSNSDGIINAQDALAGVNYWLRRSGTPDDSQILAMNVNCDSRINTFDALGIVEMFVNGTDPIVVMRAANITAQQK